MNADYIEGYLNGIGVKTRITKESFRTFGAVMGNLCNLWEGMSEDERRDLSIVMGGDILW